MGTKGDTASTKGAVFADAIVSRLESLGEVTTKGMFGGYGIYQAGKMFALATSNAELFLKTEDGRSRSGVGHRKTRETRVEELPLAASSQGSEPESSPSSPVGHAATWSLQSRHIRSAIRYPRSARGG